MPKATVKAAQKSTEFKPQQGKSSVLNMPIEEVELTVRTYNCLRRAGINAVGVVTKKITRDLFKVRNLGARGQEESIRKLRGLG